MIEQNFSMGWSCSPQDLEFKQEKAIFKKRLGGKSLCLNMSIVEFTWQNKTPSNECLYLSGKLTYSNGKFTQYIKLLKVLQAIPEGFLIKNDRVCEDGQCFSNPNPNVIFVHKTDEINIVDGSFLDEVFDGVPYEYVGPFAYQTTYGTKTVHSFRKVAADTVKKAMKGLKTYAPEEEFLAETENWWALKDWNIGASIWH